MVPLYMLFNSDIYTGRKRGRFRYRKDKQSEKSLCEFTGILGLEEKCH